MNRFRNLITGLSLCAATIVGMGISGVSRAEATDITLSRSHGNGMPGRSASRLVRDPERRLIALPRGAWEREKILGDI
jgi:hypothetical protein